MPIERVFLDWDSPCLERAADFLCSRHQLEKGHFDLQNSTLVLPGGRAERRLMEILVARAEKEGDILIPPERRTAGVLPELLYTPSLPLAQPLQRKMAWIAAIGEVEHDCLAAIISKNIEGNPLLAHAALADTFESLWSELSSAALLFSDLAQGGGQIFDFFKEDRWNALAVIHQQYLQQLAENGLADPYDQRLQALSQNACSFDNELVLIATADLRPLICKMILQADPDLCVLIHAPESLADSFDHLGCIKAHSWISREIPLQDQQIILAQGPQEQASSVVEQLASFGKPLRAEEITVGIADEELLPFVFQQMSAEHLPVRSAKGTPILRSSPAKLLKLISDYLKEPRFAHLAAVLRHPEIQSLLEVDSDSNLRFDSLSVLDRIQAEHLPTAIASLPSTSDKLINSARALSTRVDELLSTLSSSEHRFCNWSQPIIDFLIQVYGNTTLDRGKSEDRLLIESLERILAALREIAAIPEELCPKVGIDQALTLLSQHLAAQAIPPKQDSEAIELLGWLELQLDDAPLLIIAGVNEGRVPQSVNADPFLPNTLRRHLGLIDNERRHARDIYALSAMLNSRSQVILIAGRRDANNDSLQLSRLLLSCEHSTLAKRVVDFYQESESSGISSRRPSLTAKGKLPLGTPPRATALPGPTTRMSVTSFRDYLHCPYRFYLKHLLRLEQLNDDRSEMDTACFGTLAHEVLRQFGLLAISTPPENEHKLNQCLNQLLDKEVLRRFGKSPLPAVLVQVEQLRARFASFAHWQIKWSKQGWRIEQVELPFTEKEAWLELSQNRRMGLRGKIDRIDFHPEQRRWAVFDYKTGEKAKSPEETHGPIEDQWFDLQLPLYLEFLEQQGKISAPQLGYINLGKDEVVKEDFADWSREDLAQAHETACMIAEKVLEENFWPPSPNSWTSDQFADICGVGMLHSALSLEEEEE